MTVDLRTELATIARDPAFRRPCHGYANTCACPTCAAREKAFLEAVEDEHVLALYPDFDDRFAAAVTLSLYATSS